VVTSARVLPFDPSYRPVIDRLRDTRLDLQLAIRDAEADALPELLRQIDENEARLIAALEAERRPRGF
jgi:hypothetical protein